MKMKLSTKASIKETLSVFICVHLWFPENAMVMP